MIFCRSTLYSFYTRSCSRDSSTTTDDGDGHGPRPSGPENQRKLTCSTLTRGSDRSCGGRASMAFVRLAVATVAAMVCSGALATLPADNGGEAVVAAGDIAPEFAVSCSNV
jgi:hypothetical protein